MRAAYIDVYYKESTCVFTIVSFPIEQRKKWKEIFESFFPIVSFDNVDETNISEYLQYLGFFIKGNDISAISLRVRKYRRSMYCRILKELIHEVFSIYGSSMRVFIPFDTDKHFLKSVRAMTPENIFIEEIRRKESFASQLASVLSGCVITHDDDSLYGKDEKTVLSDYLYFSVKKRYKYLVKDSIIGKSTIHE